MKAGEGDNAKTAAIYSITIEDTGEIYACKPEQDLLRAMEKLGRKGIPVGCRGGGCGVCKVEIVTGDTVSKKMSRAQVTEEDEARRRVLACRTYPRSDISLHVVGKMKKSVCRDKPRLPWKGARIASGS